ncbi:MAG: ABC transporter ATP-binding protein [Gammaproteobacteria bacterium]|nr:ABC transporter ATP-binding protein [Gammaproteobacteria bacterium]
MFFEVNNIVVAYDRVTALKNVSIRMDEGQIIALIGANGAGKTTLLRACTSLVPVESGTVTFNGKDITDMKSEYIVREGITMVPEGRQIYPYMSVKDNMLMGAYLRNDKAGIRSDLDRLYTLFPRVKERMGQQAGTLSGGEQQMVAICRALMARPKLLFMDEPSLGLAPMVIREIANAIIEINREDNLSIVLVEQNSRMALRISSYAYVLETGKMALEGNSTKLIKDPHIIKLYLGG